MSIYSTTQAGERQRSPTSASGQGAAEQAGQQGPPIHEQGLGGQCCLVPAAHVAGSGHDEQADPHARGGEDVRGAMHAGCNIGIHVSP